MKIGDKVLCHTDGPGGTTLVGVVGGEPQADMNGAWFEERLRANFYRWTQTWEVTTTVATQWGGVYWNGGAYLTMPTLPVGATITDQTVSSRQPTTTGSWAMSGPTIGTYGLMAGITQATYTYRVTAVLYGTKP